MDRASVFRCRARSVSKEEAMRERLRVGRVGKGMGHSGRYKGMHLYGLMRSRVYTLWCGMHVCLLRVSACLREAKAVACVWAGGGAHVTAVFKFDVMIDV